MLIAPLSLSMIAAALLTPCVAGAQSKSQDFQWNPDRSIDIPYDQTLDKHSLPAVQKSEIETIIRKRLVTIYVSPTNKVENYEETMDNIAGNIRVAEMDVDGDGKNEVVIQGLGTELCGVVGNCFFLILKSHNRKYETMLATGAQSFQVLPSMQGGLPHLVLSLHDSASESSLREYQLCGWQYRKFATYLYKTWDLDKQLPKPRLTLSKRYRSPCTLPKP